MNDQSEHLLIAESYTGCKYLEKDVNDIFKMINLFNDLERNEINVTGHGWSLIHKKYGLHGIIELDNASGWLDIQNLQSINELLEILLSSGYNPVSASLGELQNDTFHDKNGKVHWLQQIYEEFLEANKSTLERPDFDIHPLRVSQQECQYQEGDILAGFNGSHWHLRKVLKIDKFDVKGKDKVKVQGVVFTALEAHSITVISISQGRKVYKDMNEVRRAAKHKNWSRGIEHLPFRVSQLGTDYKVVANKSVSEEELKGYYHWMDRCKEEMLAVF